MPRRALACALALGACTAHAGSTIRPGAPAESGVAWGYVEPLWARARLEEAARELHAAFSREGSEALLRLRLRPADVAALYTENAAARIARIPPGLLPRDGEQRWRMFRVFASSPPVGYCARGMRVAAASGGEGLREPAFVVDRLLLVGVEREGYWGAWVEGLVYTTEGWRLLPTVPYERQVETPRRDHADVLLWDCDVGLPPQARPRGPSGGRDGG